MGRLPDLTPGCRVYSLGVGEDVGFDLSLIQTHGAEVIAFDPTPRTSDWLASQEVPDRFHFQTADSVRLLRDHRYRIFYISPNGQEYSFIHQP